MNRTQLLQAEFAAEFCRQPGLRPPAPQEFTEAEQQLQSGFPAAYVSFLTRHGCGATPALPALAREADVWPMARLLSPLEAVTVSRAAWQKGMPRHLIAVAQSEDNDLLCFQRVPTGKTRGEEGLWTFLPEFGQAMRAFDSFDAWFQEYREARFERDEDP